MKQTTDAGGSIPEEDLREILQEEEMETHTGTCRFCGQMGTAKGPHNWDREQINEAVTCLCPYSEAREYAGKKEQVKKSEKEDYRSLWRRSRRNGPG